MTPQKMRMRLLVDRPVNVSQGEYALYTLTTFLVVVCFAGGAGMALSAFRGDQVKRADELEGLTTLTIEEAAAQGAPLERVLLEGELEADETATMPDEPGLEVAVGRLSLRASERIKGGEARSATLYEWSHSPQELWLSDGESRVRLGLTPDELPFTETPRFARPERIQDGASSRLSRTIGFRYVEQDWMLPESWEKPRSASAELARSFVPARAKLTVVGSLALGAEGVTLTPERAGSKFRVERGTAQELAAQARSAGRRLRILWLPTLLLGAWLLSRVMKKRREFVVRSNA